MHSGKVPLHQGSGLLEWAMQQIFLSADARQRNSWREAFPHLIMGRLEGMPAAPALVWALLPAGQRPEALVERLRRGLAGRLLIVLADEPEEEGALAALAAGAAAYCNGHAAPAVLQQIAAVVQNGGVWIGERLMKRLLTASSALLSQRTGENNAWRNTLTASEQEIAIAIARGIGIKDFARQLGIPERTVQFHVGSLLEKLGARDRLQLLLAINGLTDKG